MQSLDWHSKGNALVTGSADGSIWLWNCNNGENLGVFNGHERAVTKCAFAPDGKSVVSSSEDGTIRVWNPKQMALLFKVSGYNFHQDAVTTFEFGMKYFFKN